MLRRIVTNSVELVKFVFALGLSLSRPQKQHVLNLADAILVSDERKTIANLNRQLVETKDDSSVAHTLRESPWQANDLRSKILVFLVRTAVQLARTLGLEKIICLSIDDSLCEKDAATTQLEGVDWHHDHNASSKKQAAYKNGSVYLVCHLKIGFISFAINWRIYLREKSVRRINRQRAKGQRLKFRSKYRLAREMLAEITSLLPSDFQVYVLFDSWYSSAKLIKYCRQQNWHVIAGLKSNRCLNAKQLSQWHQDLRHTRYEPITLPAADGSSKTYFVRTLRGRLNEVPFEVCVLISKRHPRSKSPAYFLCTDLSLSAQEAMVWYQDRWPTEVDNFYLKTRLGLADYQMQSFEAIEKFHAIVFLALAYLQYRLGQSLAVAHQTGLLRSKEQLRTLADVIRLHRAEHDVALLKVACQLALQHNSLAPVLAKFLRPFSAITSRLDEAAMTLT
jgi:hypothetical protein